LKLATDYPFFRSKKPRIIGHRGAAGEVPENTFPSFQKALEGGAEFIELDVRSSKEGDVLVIHDARLDTTTNGRGAVRKRNLAKIKELDAGYWFSSDEGRSYPYRGRKIEIPTLEEYLSALPKAKTIIDIKQSRPTIVKQVIDIVCRLGKEQNVLLATEKDKIMRDIRKAIERSDLKVATGFSYGEAAAFFYWLAGGRRGDFVPPGQALQIPYEYKGMTLVTEETVTAAHELGIEMFVWTVNDVEEMARLLDLGVDGIMTDYPSRLRELIARNRS